jgi:hypothetical protein
MQYKYKTSKGEKSLNYHATRDADSAAWLISYQPAVLFSQNKPATSNQPTVLFSQNKPAPAISHQPTEQAAGLGRGTRPKPMARWKRSSLPTSFTSRGGHFEPKTKTRKPNRTQPNPNNPNCWSIRVSRFRFCPNKFIIRSTVSVLVVYNSNRSNNPKFNIVAYFD